MSGQKLHEAAYKGWQVFMHVPSSNLAGSVSRRPLEPLLGDASHPEHLPVHKLCILCSISTLS